MQKYGIAVFREAEALALSLASELNYLADDVAMDSRESLYEPSEGYQALMQRLSEHLEELGGLFELYSKKYQHLDAEVCA